MTPYLIPAWEGLAGICRLELCGGEIVSLAVVVLEGAAVKAVHALVEDALEGNMQHCC